MNDEANAEPDTACEECGDDVRLHKRHPRDTYQLRGLVDRRRAHHRESDPQSPENLRVPRHQMCKTHFGFWVSELRARLQFRLSGGLLWGRKGK